MKAKELMAMIRAHRGPIYAGVLTRNDVVYVQVHKASLLSAVREMGDGEMIGRVSNENLYLDNAV